MKTLILLTSILFLNSCATLTPEEQKVVGTYELKEGRVVLLKNGITEFHIGGYEVRTGDKWKITKDGQIHAVGESGFMGLWRINSDGSITGIAQIVDGKREDLSKDRQLTYKKIK